MNRSLQIPVFCSDQFELPLPRGHRFPADKYRLLREALQRGELSGLLSFQVAEAASDGQLLLVHTSEYLSKLSLGTLSRAEQRVLGFPWSPELVIRSRRSTGATLSAGRAALRSSIAIQLAGGSHHSFPDRGEGFCVLNDVAVAIRVLQSERLIQRAVVIDLDVHQGNGTATIFADDPSVFTFSIHGARNYPFKKCVSDLDLALREGTEGEAYLDALGEGLDRLPLREVDIAFFLAGADPFERDRFGKFSLSMSDLALRDRRVFSACDDHDLPVAVVMAGGYSPDVQDIVRINQQTVAESVRCFLNRPWHERVDGDGKDA